MTRTVLAWLLWWAVSAGGAFGQMAMVRQDTAHTLIANLFLHESALMYREFHTEYLECLYGRVNSDTTIVLYAIMADVKPSHSRPTTVIPQPDGVCPQNTDSLVGIVHNHPQTCRGGGGAACGLQVRDSESMHPQDDPASDPCYESYPDIRTFIASGLRLNVVICGVGKMYVQRQGSRPNDPADVCSYDAELDVPVLKCGRP